MKLKKIENILCNSQVYHKNWWFHFVQINVKTLQQPTQWLVMLVLLFLCEWHSAWLSIHAITQP